MLASGSSAQFSTPTMSKKAGRKNKVYSQSAVKEALRRVDLGELSIRRAAREYGIPPSTLRDKASGKIPIEAVKGPDPFMTRAEEERLSDWAVSMHSTGQKCTKNDIQEMAQSILDSDGRKTPFKDNKPGNRWFRSFIMRNPKVIMHMGKEKNEVITRKIIDEWKIMPKKKPLTPRPVKSVYSQSAVHEALRRIDLGEMSIRKAAREYGVPNTTLRDKLGGRTPVEAKRGANPHMSPEEEARLADWVVSMKTSGQKCTSKDIQEMAQRLIEAEGRETPFRDKKPGSGWLKLFITRNPKVAEFFGRPKKLVIEAEVVDKWFVDLKEFLEEKNCLSILEFPDRMWHFDEQPFGIWKDGLKVQGFRMKSAATNHSEQVKKRQVTALLGISASGLYSPPLIGYPGSELPEGVSQPAGGPRLCYLGSCQSGGIDAELFLSWLKDLFLPYLINRDIHFPVLVLIDGRSTCVDEKVEKFCAKKLIVLYKFPTESSRAVNPMELGVRSDLKKAYMQAERSWREEHPCQPFSTVSFHDVLLDTWATVAMKPELAQVGFWCAGLSPFDGQYNKEKNTHPYFREPERNINGISDPTQVHQVPYPLPGTVEVTIAPEDRDILELIAASEGCEVILDERTVNHEDVTTSAHEDVAVVLKQVIKTETQNAKSPARPQRNAKRTWKSGQRWSAAATSPKEKTAFARKRKLHVEEAPDIALPFDPKKEQKTGDRPGNELQQMRWAIRDARSAMREAEHAARDAIAEVKDIKKELSVAEVVERDTRKELRRAKKVLKEAEKVLREYRVKEKSEERPAPANVNDAIDENTCPVCAVTYDSGDSNGKLVSCTNCPRRYHIMCTDLFCVPDEKIPQIQYRCPFCAYLWLGCDNPPSINFGLID